VIGLGYIIFFAIYFFFTWFFARAAQRGIRERILPKVVGAGIWLIAIAALFWDVVPIHVVHGRLCEKDGGFVLYKTLDQWSQENPGVIETLEPTDANDSQIADTERFVINQRFVMDITRSEVWHLISQRRDEIVDVQTGEVLARYIDYYTNLGNPVAGTARTGWQDYKMWIQIRSCEEGNREEQIQFNEYKQILESIGRR